MPGMKVGQQCLHDNRSRVDLCDIVLFTVKDNSAEVFSVGTQSLVVSVHVRWRWQSWAGPDCSVLPSNETLAVQGLTQ